MERHGRTRHTQATKRNGTVGDNVRAPGHRLPDPNQRTHAKPSAALHTTTPNSIPEQQENEWQPTQTGVPSSQRGSSRRAAARAAAERAASSSEGAPACGDKIETATKRPPLRQRLPALGSPRLPAETLPRTPSLPLNKRKKSRPSGLGREKSPLEAHSRARSIPHPAPCRQ